MNPLVLALISAGVFVVGLIILICNMMGFMNSIASSVTQPITKVEQEFKSATKRIVLHFLCGVLCFFGAVGLIGSLVWFIIGKL